MKMEFVDEKELDLAPKRHSLALSISSLQVVLPVRRV